MKLRWQLILVSLLTLILPWAGFQYVVELESVLRQAEEDSLRERARLIATRLEERNLSLYGSNAVDAQRSFPAHDLYTHRLPQAPTLDGFPDDWLHSPLAAPWQQAGNPPGTRYLAGLKDEYFYLYIDTPGLGENMDVILALEDDRSRLKRFRFEPAPPGVTSPARLESKGSVEWRIQATRQESRQRAHIEIRIPAIMVEGRMGFLVRDGDDHPLAGSISREQMRPGLLIYGGIDLPELLARYNSENQRVLLSGPRGWVLASQGEFAPAGMGTPNGTRPMSINARLYRLALDRKYPDYPQDLDEIARLSDEVMNSSLPAQALTRLYAMPDSDRLILSLAIPLYNRGELSGTLLVEEVTSRVLTLADQALSRLVGLSLMATLLAAVGLLGYSTYLSLRIRRLRDAAGQALQPGGRLHTQLPGTRRGDELGDLARSFQALLRELDEYTLYLQNLGDTLAHELRTPMTVVKSSLDNLENEDLPEAAQPYLRRAGEGVNRLHRILSALREAARIEQGVRHIEHEAMDLGQLVKVLTSGYRDAFPQRRFEAFIPDTPCPMHGTPDLLAQMMDKLVENAVEFSPERGRIHIRLQQQAGRLQLSVANEGPRLPAEARQKIFDSLVSMRGKRDGSPHLGLGLHVVKLIAENHGGSVSAGDSQVLSGAEFKIELPADQALRIL